jgi:hypothetical protein
MIVVANAGPLIALARIGHVRLLPALFEEIFVPPAVVEEVVGQGLLRAGAAELAAAPWLRTVEVGDQTAVQLLRQRLDPGESMAIVLALELKADLLLIDEARGRRIAEARGLAKMGTVGTLVAAKQRGLLPAVAPLVDRLRASGFRMSDELLQAAVRLADESRK